VTRAMAGEGGSPEAARLAVEGYPCRRKHSDASLESAATAGERGRARRARDAGVHTNADGQNAAGDYPSLSQPDLAPSLILT